MVNTPMIETQIGHENEHATVAKRSYGARERAFITHTKLYLP